MKQLKRIPQYTRHRRHLWAVLTHGTPRKWANLLHVEGERRLRRLKLKSYPYLLILDPCNYCNLQCPLCPTGRRELGRPQHLLSFDEFKKYFDPLAPYLFEVSLHNWGEPLLNKQVYQMVEYAQGHNVGTNVSSNFLDVNSNDLDNLLASGLEYLVVSLDGTSQETYGKYRIRGNYERVISNLSELIRRRRARHQRLPVIEWQYIIFKHNEDHIPQAEALAKKLGVDVLRFIPPGIPFELANRTELIQEWYPVSTVDAPVTKNEPSQLSPGSQPGPCFYLFRSLVVNTDGGVSPCCVVYRQDRDFATLAEPSQSFAAIWNNLKFQSARSLFSPYQGPTRVAIVCDECSLFTWHPSKKN